MAVRGADAWSSEVLTDDVIDALDTDEDCDGITFWRDPDDDGDVVHDTLLVTLTSKLVPATGSPKKEFKGHVSLLK